MTITITQAQAVDLLNKAVKEKGADYKYETVDKGYGGTCVYTKHDGSPSCIVGHALAYAGVPQDVLHAIDFGGAVTLEEWDEENEEYYEQPTEVKHETGLDETGIIEPNVLYWLKKNGVDIDDRAAEIFGRAQRQQDNGILWGEAVNNAITGKGF